MQVKYSHTCAKEINLMLFRRFSGFKTFLLKMKKIDNYGLNYHRYMVQPLVLRIMKYSFKIRKYAYITGKKFLLPLRGEYCPHVYKIIYDLTIVIINKYFEFQNDWLKIIRIRYSCMKFCSLPLC